MVTGNLSKYGSTRQVTNKEESNIK